MSFGDSIDSIGIIGDPLQYLNFKGVLSKSSNIPFLLFAIFQLKFDVITPISGYKHPQQLQVLLTFFNEVYSSDIPSDKMQPIWDKYNETFEGTW